MATNIGKLAVTLSTDTSRFTSGMTSAAGVVSRVQASVARATDAARAWEATTASMKPLKLAGTDTLDSIKTAVAVARSELNKLGRNKDVRVAVEIAREQIDEAWLRAKAILQRAVNASRLKIAGQFVGGKAADMRAWVDQQRRSLTKPITVRVELARRAVEEQLAGVRSKLEGLKRFRAVRIGLAAVNGIKAPTQAALDVLGPVRRLATSGVKVALSATHAGIATGVQKARALFGQLASAGKGLASVLFSSFTVIGAGIAGVVAGGSLVMMTRQSMDAIDVNAKLADRLGTTTEGLVGLQYAGNLAGVSSEQVTTGLEKMLKSLGGAADDSELASNAFTKLGLSAAELAKMPADQAFSTIAQKISDIQNPAERATAAMQIFGKSGQELLPLMTSGAEGIKAAQEEAAKLGLTYNRVDAAKVEQANDAITRMSSIFTGVSNQLAIGLAPYIEAAATKFTELATAGGGIGPMVGGAVEWVATGIASLSDYVQLLPAGFHGFRAGALEAIAGVLGAIDTLGGGMVQFMNLLPGVNLSWTDTFGTLKQGMEQVAGEEADKMDEALGKFQRGDNAAAVAKTFEDIRAKSTAAAKATADNAEKMRGAFKGLEDSTVNLQKVSATLDELRKENAQFGLSDGQKKMQELQGSGANPQQLADAQKLVDLHDQMTKVSSIDTGDPMSTYASKMEALQKLYAQGVVTAQQFDAMRQSASTTLNDKLADSAKSITESVKTPLENYRTEIEKLATLFDKGLITQDTLDRATAKARDTLNGGKTDPNELDKGASAIRAGSQEAIRFAFDSARGPSQLSNPVELAKASLKTQEKATQALQTLVRASRDSTTTTPDEVTL